MISMLILSIYLKGNEIQNIIAYSNQWAFGTPLLNYTYEPLIGDNTINGDTFSLYIDNLVIESQIFGDSVDSYLWNDNINSFGVYRNGVLIVDNNITSLP